MSDEIKKIECSQKFYDGAKAIAQKKGTSLRGVTVPVLDQLDLADGNEKVILSIPVNLTRGDREGLKKWLQTRMDVVLSSYYPKG